jgi:hypothetical protein
VAIEAMFVLGQQALDRVARHQVDRQEDDAGDQPDQQGGNSEALEDPRA